MTQSTPSPRILKETIYTPDSELLRPGEILRHVWESMPLIWELAWRLTIRNTKAKYRQTMLGYFWAVAPPMFTAATFFLLQYNQILQVGETGIPYPAYVLCGTVLWQTFERSLMAPSHTVQKAKPILAKVNFPKEALLLNAFLETGLDVLLSLVVLLALYVVFGVPLGLSMLLAPFGILGIMTIAMSIGLLLAPLGMLYQDIDRGMGFLLRIMFFLTPVIYPAPAAGSFKEWLVLCNPAAPAILVTRELLTGMPLSYPGLFLGTLGGSLVLWLLGWLVFRLAMPHLIERTSNF